jgi:hypothetical protein
MASSYSALNRLEKQGTGDNSGTWGDRLNTNVIDLLDEAIDGVNTKSATGSGDITLSTANGSTDEARHKVQVFTGTPVANRNVIVPAVEKLYVIDNQTDAFALVIKTSGGSGVTVSNGEKAIVYCDGTDVIKIWYSGDSDIPSGIITMWSGTIATIPTGWSLCDGTGSTPDLRDQFVVGATSDDGGAAKTNLTGSLTQSGGSLTTDSQGAHTHTGTTGSHTLTTDEIPSHTHSYSVGTGGFNAGSGGFTVHNTTSGSTTGATGGGSGHTHTISSDGAHTHTATPPYYALAYIMKD